MDYKQEYNEAYYSLNDINWNDFVDQQVPDHTGIIKADDNCITSFTGDTDTCIAYSKMSTGTLLTTSSVNVNTWRSEVGTFSYSNIVEFRGDAKFLGTTTFDGVTTFNNNTKFESSVHFYNGITAKCESSFDTITVTNELRLGNYGPDFAPFIKCLPSLIKSLGYNNSWDIQQMAGSTSCYCEPPALGNLDCRIIELENKMREMEQRCAKI